MPDEYEIRQLEVQVGELTEDNYYLQEENKRLREENEMQANLLAEMGRKLGEQTVEIHQLREGINDEREITEDLAEIAKRRARKLTIVTAARNQLREENERLKADYAHIDEVIRQKEKENAKLRREAMLMPTKYLWETDKGKE